MAKISQNKTVLVESIGVRTFQYQDVLRKRPVAVELWYPIDVSVNPAEVVEDLYLHPKESRGAQLSSALKKYPLVLMSHGHGGDRRDRSWLAERLVKANFIVASVEHHGNSRAHFDPILTLKYWDRAKDVIFALDQILDEPFLKGKIDLGQIGFTGYSLGGMTGLALAGCTVEKMEDLVDENREVLAGFPPEALKLVDFSEASSPHSEPRIKALLLLAPANFLYKPEALKNIRVPVGLVSAINDEVLPHARHAYPIIQHVVPVKLKVLRKEISHFTFLNQISALGKKVLPAKHQTDPECCSRSAIHKEVGDFAVDFFREVFSKKQP